ncbi:MAG: ARPP-2 domain-containing protein [Trichormus sp.]
MAQKKRLLADISLKGLDIAPSQVRGAVRIVPLIRRNIRGDLRLNRRSYEEDITIVNLEGQLTDPGIKYFSYVPHGLVMSWTDDGSPVASFGGQILKTDGQSQEYGCASVRLMQRMAKRESANQLRFLPLHLAMEGFLSLFFSGPTIAWREYSKYALSHGLGSRYETAVSGRYIAGLEDALRVFEIHEQQVGVLVFVAESLASAFVVPTPEDYRALHTSLLEDFYGELIYQYSLLYDTTWPMETTVDESKINSLADLRGAIVKMRQDWASFQGFMAEGLLQRQLNSQIVYTAGSFLLQRFITDLQLKQENYIGEAIIRESGEIEYLKTYRLSEAQTRRVYLLSKLAEHNWNLEATAKALSQTSEDFIARIESAGFGYLLNQSVREAALKKTKKSRR